MMQKTWKMTETLANGYSYESTQQELSNEYQHDRVSMVFEKYLRLCALDERSLSIRRVKSCIKPSQCLIFQARFPSPPAMDDAEAKQRESKWCWFIEYRHTQRSCEWQVLSEGQGPM